MKSKTSMKKAAARCPICKECKKKAKLIADLQAQVKTLNLVGAITQEVIGLINDLVGDIRTLLSLIHI